MSELRSRSEIRIADDEAIRRSNAGFKERLAARMIELHGVVKDDSSDSDYENFLEDHVKSLIDEHAGQKAEEARVAGESAAKANVEIATKANAALKKKKARAKAKADKEFESVKRKSKGMVDLAVQLLNVKKALAHRVEVITEFSNECHGEDGRFCSDGGDSGTNSKTTVVTPNASSGLDEKVQKL